MNGFTDVNVRPSCEELALPCTSPKTFPDFGWSLSGARAISDWLALTGEVAVANNTWYSRPLATSPGRQSRHSFTIGPRLATPFLHKSGGDPIDFRVFGQVLFGAQVSNVARRWQRHPAGRRHRRAHAGRRHRSDAVRLLVRSTGSRAAQHLRRSVAHRTRRRHRLTTGDWRLMTGLPC